jgi:hypothetical protein
MYLSVQVSEVFIEFDESLVEIVEVCQVRQVKHEGWVAAQLFVADVQDLGATDSKAHDVDVREIGGFVMKGRVQRCRARLTFDQISDFMPNLANENNPLRRFFFFCSATVSFRSIWVEHLSREGV